MSGKWSIAPCLILVFGFAPFQAHCIPQQIISAACCHLDLPATFRLYPIEEVLNRAGFFSQDVNMSLLASNQHTQGHTIYTSDQNEPLSVVMYKQYFREEGPLTNGVGGHFRGVNRDRTNRKKKTDGNERVSPVCNTFQIQQISIP